MLTTEQLGVDGVAAHSHGSLHTIGRLACVQFTSGTHATPIPKLQHTSPASQFAALVQSAAMPVANIGGEQLHVVCGGVL